jgi:uncharacterized protein
MAGSSLIGAMRHIAYDKIIGKSRLLALEEVTSRSGFKSLHPHFFKMKTISVKVIPNAKINQILEEEDRLRVHLTKPAIDGKANISLIKVLSEYLNVKKSQIKIIKGEKTRDKILMIE